MNFRLNKFQWNIIITWIAMGSPLAQPVYGEAMLGVEGLRKQNSLQR